MKKFSMYLLVLALGSFSITGCGGSGKPEQIEQTATQADFDAEDAAYEAEMEAAEEDEQGVK